MVVLGDLVRAVRSSVSALGWLDRRIRTSGSRTGEVPDPRWAPMRANRARTRLVDDDPTDTRLGSAPAVTSSGGCLTLLDDPGLIVGAAHGTAARTALSMALASAHGAGGDDLVGQTSSL